MDDPRARIASMLAEAPQAAQPAGQGGGAMAAIQQLMAEMGISPDKLPMVMEALQSMGGGGAQQQGAQPQPMQTRI